MKIKSTTTTTQTSSSFKRQTKKKIKKERGKKDYDSSPWKYKSWHGLAQQCDRVKPSLFTTDIRRGVLDTTLCDKVCQWLTTGRWFSPGTSTNKTDRHDINEILLKVVLYAKIKKIQSTTDIWCYQIFS